MGDTDAAESREVEQNAARYPDVKAELEAIQSSLELYATAHSAAPPTGLKNQIWSKIQSENTSTKTVANDPVPTRRADTKVIDISRYRTLLAAASVALLVSLGVNYYLYNRWNDTSARLASMQSEQTELAKQFEAKRASFEQSQQELALLSKPTMKPVMLKGTPTHSDALAMVYMDMASHDVYLMVNNMPATPSDKQYQLWAIVDGKPVDAGVFSMSGDTSGLHKMGRFENAQAFAVTMERLGGSPTPTMETMVVIGNI